MSMFTTTLAFTVLAFVTRALAQDEAGGDPTPTASPAPSATAAAPSALPTTMFNNALPYCKFSGIKLQCAPLTTHQKLFVALSITSIALMFILLVTLCCCCCCRRRRPKQEIFISSSTVEAGAPTTSQPYGSYAGQPSYGSRLNGGSYGRGDSKGAGSSGAGYTSHPSRG